jgi:hypothetical protein
MFSSLRIIRMCIIDSSDKLFLIRLRIKTPRSAYNSHVTFFYRMARNFERSQTILDLANWIESIEFCTHHCWLIRDITFREILIRRAVDTFPGTTPEFRQKRDNRNSRERTNRAFPEKLMDADIIRHFSLFHKIIISFNKCYRRNHFRKLVLSIDIIFKHLKGLLRFHFCVLPEAFEDSVDDFEFLIHNCFLTFYVFSV